MVTTNAFVHSHWAKMPAKAVLGCVKINKGKSHLKQSWGELPSGPVVILLKGMQGVRLLAAQKPVNRPGWWKGKFALFQMPDTGGGGWQARVQRPDDKQGVRAVIDRGGAGLRTETAVISNSHLHLVVRGLTGSILVVLATVNLHFRGTLVPMSLRSALRIVAARVLGTV